MIRRECENKSARESHRLAGVWFPLHVNHRLTGNASGRNGSTIDDLAGQ